MEGNWPFLQKGFPPAWMQTQDSRILKRFPLGASRQINMLSSLMWKLTGGLSWIRVCYKEECTVVATPTVTSGKFEAPYGL